AKFLRVLQEREFLRLGGTRPVRANIRLVAATNRDLQDAVAAGDFRADLYYRLNVFEIRLPPLRERRQDILPLAETFLREFARDTADALQLMPDARDALLRHDWPGNVRELRNVIERATIICEDGAIGAQDLSLVAAPMLVGPSTDLGALERRTIERVMRQVLGNKALASRQLGITRTQLYQRLRKYGLDTDAE